MSGVPYAAGNFSENISIENLTFNDLSIDISMVKNFTVKNIGIDGKPLSVLNSVCGSVIDCTIKNSTSYGVLVYNSKNVVFDYCRSFNNRNAGFYIITGNQGIVFRHSVAVSNLTHGFSVGGAATILQCIANINVVNGINCTSGLVGDSIISGNILTYNGSYGIAINTSLQTGLPITGNYTYGSGPDR